MRLTPILVAVVLLFTVKGTADACSCVIAGPACQEYFEHAAVFVGKVQSIARSSNTSRFSRRVVTFDVVEPFSGVTSGRVEVRTGAGGGDCGYAFKTGGEYLVYARRDPQSGALTTGICSRTKPVANAGDDLAFLRSLGAGAQPVSRVSGSVRLYRRSMDAQREPPPAPLSGIGVILERDGRSFETSTKEDGSFVFEGLEPGKYAARLALPDRYYSMTLPADLTLTDARGCVEMDAPVGFDGRVAGRVLDAASKPIGGLTVELTPRSTVERPYAQRLRTITSADGRYEFTRVPAGKFVVGINTELDRSGGAAEPRVFHPGSREPRDAQTIVLAEGARMEAADFVLPADVRYVTVTGVVMDAAGVPARGARVYLKGAEERDFLRTIEPAVTDGSGRFAIAVLEGNTYRIFAERQPNQPGGRLEISDPQPLSVPRGNGQLVLRLKPNY